MDPESSKVFDENKKAIFKKLGVPGGQPEKYLVTVGKKEEELHFWFEGKVEDGRVFVAEVVAEGKRTRLGEVGF